MKKSTAINFAIIIIFIIYFLMLSYILLFKNVPPLQIFSQTRGNYRGLNAIPFGTVYNYYFSGFVNNNYIATLNILGNIIIFVPLGIICKMQLEKRNSVSIIYIFLISLSVEIVQYIFALGVSDIDDIILNTIGGAMGVGIYNVIIKRFKDKNKAKVFIIMSTVIITLIYIVFKLYLSTKGIRMRLL